MVKRKGCKTLAMPETENRREGRNLPDTRTSSRVEGKSDPGEGSLSRFGFLRSGGRQRDFSALSVGSKRNERHEFNHPLSYRRLR